MIENQKSIALSLSDTRISIQVFWIFAFGILTAIGAQLEIPNQPVPFTFQTLFVLLAGALLGRRNGAASMGFYLLLGALGLPVFSGFASGVSRIFGPTGGYLLSFPAAAFIVGYLVQLHHKYWWMVVSMILGSLIILSVGTIFLNFFYLHNWLNSFQAGFLIFSWWDAVKVIGGASIVHYYFRVVNYRRD